MIRRLWLPVVLAACAVGDIGEFEGRESEAPGRVLMKALGEDVRVLHRISGSAEENPAVAAEVRRRAIAVERRLELSRKINRSAAFSDNLTRSVVAAQELAGVADDPVERQKAVLRLERTCTRCHTRLW